MKNHQRASSGAAGVSQNVETDASTRQRVAILLASGPSDIPQISIAAIIAGVIVTLPLMAGVALLGARRARRTQAGFYARIYLHRLPAEDRDAALALLDETAAARRA